MNDMFTRSLQSICLLILFTAAAFAQGSGTAGDLERVRLAASYSAENNGIAMLVVKGDKVIFEDYRFPMKNDRAWLLASGTKSFTGVICAAAIEDKLISGFDEKVSETITEWKDDPRRSKITIRQLLSLTSGLDSGGISLSAPPYSRSINAEAIYEPGTKFEYGPVPFQVFGELMTRKLIHRKETVMEYLQRRILDPIDAKASNWQMSGGQPLLPHGASFTAREWAKFGRLLKDRGKWNGKQIIDAKLLDELVIGTKINPAYGVSFWLNAEGTGPSGNRRPTLFDKRAELKSKGSDVYMAAGLGNQRLYIIPSLDMVIVRFGIFGGFDDAEFLSHIIAKN